MRTEGLLRSHAYIREDLRKGRNMRTRFLEAAAAVAVAFALGGCTAKKTEESSPSSAPAATAPAATDAPAAPTGAAVNHPYPNNNNRLPSNPLARNLIDRSPARTRTAAQTTGAGATSTTTGTTTGQTNGPRQWWQHRWNDGTTVGRKKAKALAAQERPARRQGVARRRPPAIVSLPLRAFRVARRGLVVPIFKSSCADERIGVALKSLFLDRSSIVYLPRCAHIDETVRLLGPVVRFLCVRCLVAARAGGCASTLSCRVCGSMRFRAQGVRRRSRVVVVSGRGADSPPPARGGCRCIRRGSAVAAGALLGDDSSVVFGCSHPKRTPPRPRRFKNLRAHVRPFSKVFAMIRVRTHKTFRGHPRTNDVCVVNVGKNRFLALRRRWCRLQPALKRVTEIRSPSFKFYFGFAGRILRLAR